ncbi:MAG: hypothetical protein KAI90_03280, partial [Desulfobulbaceae bacterium]|nr:hypothetical protein [Desulfobulbaceae bacterium]
METSFDKNKKGQKQQSAISIFIFLSVVTALYGLAFLAAPEKSMSALLFGLKILTRLGPVLLLVFFLMFLTNLFIKPNWIRQHLGHDSAIKGFL